MNNDKASIGANGPNMEDMIRNGDGRSPSVAKLDGVDIHYNFLHKKDSRNLLVIFHGACDRSKRKFPAFNVFFPADIDAHQINIFDSTMLLDGDFQIGWYAGSEGVPLQAALGDFFERIKQILGVEKVIFLGTSGGGFAALLNSWRMPDSVAIVANPQTNISRYYDGHVVSYMNSSWPKLAGKSELADVITSDLAPLYSQGMNNNVVYLQSCGDYFHHENHMKPFFNTIKGGDAKKFLLVCSYWGVIGHSNSVPYKHIETWLRAVVATGEFKKEDILSKQQQIAAEATVAVDERRAPQKAKQYSDRDVSLADALANIHLQAAEGSRS